MELIKKNIHMERQIKWGTIQISLEEDQNISDQKPDAFRIICKKTDVIIREIKPVEEAVWIKGKVRYEILYLTDEKEKSLCNMEGELPFEERIYTDKNVSSEGLRVLSNVEDLTIRLINSRKLNIRTILCLSLIQDQLYDEEIVMDVENPRECEILKKPLEFTTVILDTKDIFRIHEEIQVPDGYPNIYNMLWKDIKINSMVFTPMDGRMAVSGEMKAFFLYEGEDDENVPHFFETNRPFSGILEVPESRENMQHQVDYEAEKINIEVRADYDGEEREITLDMEWNLYIKLFQNSVLPLVADAYGIHEKMTPVMREGHLVKILKRENGKIKAGMQWENKEETENELQIIHTDGILIEEKMELVEDGMHLEGVIHVDLLCRSNAESNLYQCIAMDIPYAHDTINNGKNKNSMCCGNVCIDQINATVQGNYFDVKVILSYQVQIFEEMKEPLLAELKKTEEEADETLFPVMSVYFAKDKESIWDIGKRYQVPLESIRRINELSTDELQEGQQLLVVKEMIS